MISLWHYQIKKFGFPWDRLGSTGEELAGVFKGFEFEGIATRV